MHDRSPPEGWFIAIGGYHGRKWYSAIHRYGAILKAKVARRELRAVLRELRRPNLGSNKGKPGRQAILVIGAKLFFLPQYSHDLNPIVP